MVVAGAESGAFGQTRVLGGRRVAGVEISVAYPQTVDGTVLRGLSVPLFIPVGAARRRPLEGGVAAMLHVLAKLDDEVSWVHWVRCSSQ
jgi:hypothetical protein